MQINHCIGFPALVLQVIPDAGGKVKVVFLGVSQDVSHALRLRMQTEWTMREDMPNFDNYARTRLHKAGRFAVGGKVHLPSLYILLQLARRREFSNVTFFWPAVA
jgi:hypothetical protein